MPATGGAARRTKIKEAGMLYKILGSNGQEYESIPAEKVRQWIKENRVERKTPVMPADAEDWVFLESLPEFAGMFPSPLSQAAPLPAGRNRGRAAVYLGLILLAVIIGFFILKHKKPL
jgi:hypothetical protein